MQPPTPSTKPKINTSRTPARRGGLMPTRSQWAQWSLPSKLTLIGTLVGIAGVLLSVGFYVWPLGTPTVASREIPDSASTSESREALDPRRAREAQARALAGGRLQCHARSAPRVCTPSGRLCHPAAGASEAVRRALRRLEAHVLQRRRRFGAPLEQRRQPRHAGDRCAGVNQVT